MADTAQSLAVELRAMLAALNATVPGAWGPRSLWPEEKEGILDTDLLPRIADFLEQVTPITPVPTGR